MRGRWLTALFKHADDFVFATTTRRGLNYRHAGDALPGSGEARRAQRAGEAVAPLAASWLRQPAHRRAARCGVRQCQLGHANANVTLSVYAHLFAEREHGEVARQALQASWEAMAEAGRELEAASIE